MTAIPLENRGPASGRASAVGPAVATYLALGLVVAVRWQIFRTGALDGTTEGLVFGLALIGIAWLGGLRLSMPAFGPLTSGLAAGGALVALSLLARGPLPPMALGHAAPFLPWVAVTTLVATGEELVLRGTLWRWTAAVAGDAAALLVMSVLFALIHVPVYGPSVMPLDFGVGLLFGGLRLWFGGPAAPAAAHVLADLATWWL